MLIITYLFKTLTYTKNFEEGVISFKCATGKETPLVDANWYIGLGA